MKAEEVIRRYQAGERNFRRVNLRGQSFKGQDLSEADFSEVDIRGANFTKTILKGANFSCAKGGLQGQWVIRLLIISLLLAVVAGLSSAIAGYFVMIFFLPPNIQEYSILLGVTVAVGFASFIVVTVRQGLEGSLWAVVVIAGTFAGAGLLFGGPLVALTIAVIAVTVAAAALGAVAVALAETVAQLGWLAGFALVAPSAAMSLASEVARMVTAVGIVFEGAWLAASLIVVGLYAYIGWRSLIEQKRYAGIRKCAIAVAATGGTSFRGADLTDANFTKATLKNTDFRGALVTRTCWFQAKKLALARVGKTYLEKTQVRQLVNTGEGQDNNFDNLSLQGVNLRGANLVGASLIGTDLNEANLQDAKLTRAKLVQTQLKEADLTGATLTGAWIEDWGITSHTKLDGVKCKYVFMRLVKKGDLDQNPRRKPDNWAEIFEGNDFADFIKPIKDTLDIYHNQGVDPRAIAISFKQLAENHPEAELEIVAMEKRGEDKILLRAKTAKNADHSELSKEYFLNYNQLKAIAEMEIQKLIAEKDIRIHSLETMVNTALKSHSFYIENYQHQGDIMPENSGINISSAGGNVDFNNQGVLNLGTISGNVTNAINQLPDSPQSNQPGIKEILTELQEAIEKEENLNEEDKSTALEQVKVLAEAGQKPKEGAMQKAAKSAITMLRGTVTVLPATATLVEACSKLLPLITKLFGLG